MGHERYSGEMIHTTQSKTNPMYDPDAVIHRNIADLQSKF